MAKTYPPDGWTPNSCTWSTHVDHNTALTNRIGGSCIQFKSACSAGYLDSDHFIPVETGRPYYVRALAQADSVAANCLAILRSIEYNQSQVAVRTNTLYSAVLAGAGSWYEIGGIVSTTHANTRYIKLQYGKTHVGTAFNCYFDYVGLEKTPLAFSSYRSSTQSINATTNTTITYNAEAFDYGANHSAGVWTAPTDCWMNFEAAAQIVSLDAGSFAQLAIRVNGSVVAYGDRAYAPASGAVSQIARCSSGLVAVNRGEACDVQVYHDAGGARNVNSGMSVSFFRGWQVI